MKRVFILITFILLFLPSIASASIYDLRWGTNIFKIPDIIGCNIEYLGHIINKTNVMIYKCEEPLTINDFEYSQQLEFSDFKLTSVFLINETKDIIKNNKQDKYIDEIAVKKMKDNFFYLKEYHLKKGYIEIQNSYSEHNSDGNYMLYINMEKEKTKTQTQCSYIPFMDGHYEMSCTIFYIQKDDM